MTSGEGVMDALRARLNQRGTTAAGTTIGESVGPAAVPASLGETAGTPTTTTPSENEPAIGHAAIESE
jgi:hypothetical protein